MRDALVRWIERTVCRVIGHRWRAIGLFDDVCVRCDTTRDLRF